MTFVALNNKNPWELTQQKSLTAISSIITQHLAGVILPYSTDSFWLENTATSSRGVGRGGSKGAVAPLVFYAAAPLVFCGCTNGIHYFLTAPLYSSLFQLTCVLVVLSPCNS